MNAQAQMPLSEFLNHAWKRYVKVTPDAEKVHRILAQRGEKIINDHVAFRTFNLFGIDRLHLGKIFEKWGYKAVEDLDFPEKKIIATYYTHTDASLPKIFISELLVEQFSKELQTWIKDISAPALRMKTDRAEFFLQSSWDPIRFEDYERFYPTSEYAAWTGAFGVQVNHFTVLVNQLTTFQSLEELDQFLTEQGFILNSSGGVIKGTPSELLEQSSTMGHKILWKFAGNIEKPIMGCYYEFARRYLIPGTTRLFEGFIPKSANKIFESTFEKKKTENPR